MADEIRDAATWAGENSRSRAAVDYHREEIFLTAES